MYQHQMWTECYENSEYFRCMKSHVPHRGKILSSVKSVKCSSFDVEISTASQKIIRSFAVIYSHNDNATMKQENAADQQQTGNDADSEIP